MRRQLRSRSKKRVKVKTPGGKAALHFKKKRPAPARCARCGRKLNRAKLNSTEIRKVTKVQRRPERPYPELCPSCMREVIKERVRLNA